MSIFTYSSNSIRKLGNKEINININNNETKDEYVSLKCPNCGNTNLKGLNEEKCEYCGSILVKTSSKKKNR